MSNKKIYVGNLVFSANDDALRELFSAVGAVESARVVVDQQSGRSKGFGFVEMATDDDAQKAVDSLHEKDFHGRKLNVQIARPQESRGPRRPMGGGRPFRRSSH